MKKSAFPAALLLLGICLSGCPIYNNDTNGCFDDYDCQGGYVCDGDTGACLVPSSFAPTCQAPSDCNKNDSSETCSRSGTCMVGDCHFASIGCVSGYACSSVSGSWQCEPESAGEGGSDSGAGGNSTTVSGGGEPNTTSGGAAGANSSGAGG